MSWLKWLFMSKYKRLMYSLSVLMKNKQRAHLECGLVLDFETMTIETEKKCGQEVGHG